MEAAVGAAAHAALSALYPSQKAFFDARHHAAGISGAATSMKDGHQFGLTVAAAILDDRAGDPGAGDDGYAASVHPGGHRVDPDNPEQGYHAPFWGSAKLFASSLRLGLGAPPALGSAEYMRAAREVRRKGIAASLMGTLPADVEGRSAHETLVGLFWGYDGARQLGTPPRLYNQIVRVVAQDRGNTPAKNARLFAFVNAAMADAGILAWADKYKYDLWRPVVGIREHDASMGPAATGGHAISDDCDPYWLPLGAPSTNGLDAGSAAKNFTPPFPAYPSGHATFGAAALHVTRLFYNVPVGDRSADTLFDGQTLISDELNGVNRDNLGTVRPRHARTFPKGLWEMIEENGRSRVYLGVHWVFDAFATRANGSMDLTKNVGGVRLGVDIAEDIFTAGNRKAPKKSSV